MKYVVNSDFWIQSNGFKTSIYRADTRTRESEMLVWSWRPIVCGDGIPDDCLLNQDKYENEAFLQSMLDLAWSRGLKPAGYRDENPQLEATKYHLEDMRKLVFREAKL